MRDNIPADPLPRTLAAGLAAVEQALAAPTRPFGLDACYDGRPHRWRPLTSGERIGHGEMASDSELDATRKCGECGAWSVVASVAREAARMATQPAACHCGQCGPVPSGAKRTPCNLARMAGPDTPRTTPTYTATWDATGKPVYTSVPPGNRFGLLPYGAMPSAFPGPDPADEWNGARFGHEDGAITVRRDSVPAGTQEGEDDPGSYFAVLRKARGPKLAALALAALLPLLAAGPAHAAKRPACQPVPDGKGGKVWARPVKGGWSTVSCEPSYTVRATDRVKASAGFEVRPGATPEHCTVWVHPKSFVKVIAQAVDACTDEMADKGGA